MPKRITENLTPHASGRYCKRIHGKLHYFGWAGCTEDDARDEFRRFLKRLESPGDPDPGLTVRRLADEHYFACETRVREGTLQRRTLIQYDQSMRIFVKAVGQSTPVERLTVEHFRRAREAFAKGRTPTSVHHLIINIRSMFTWGKGNRWIKDIPHYGNGFDLPTRSERRRMQVVRAEQGTTRRLTPAELKAILNHRDCVGDLLLWILLGLNSGMYSVDLSDLRWEDYRRSGRIAYIFRTREKTQALQQFPVWPEVQAMLDERKRDKGRMFTGERGAALNNRFGYDAVGRAFTELYRKAIGANARPGIGFGSVRHTHTSAVGAVGTTVQRRMIRGHTPDEAGIESAYEIPTLDQLKVITDHARQVLYLSNVKVQASASRSASGRRRS